MWVHSILGDAEDDVPTGHDSSGDVIVAEERPVLRKLFPTPCAGFMCPEWVLLPNRLCPDCGSIAGDWRYDGPGC
jgi:hypothetical protein